MANTMDTDIRTAITDELLRDRSPRLCSEISASIGRDRLAVMEALHTMRLEGIVMMAPITDGIGDGYVLRHSNKPTAHDYLCHEGRPELCPDGCDTQPVREWLNLYNDCSSDEEFCRRAAATIDSDIARHFARASVRR